MNATTITTTTTTARNAIDILGIGCCAVDDVLYVNEYPPADCKAKVLRRERRCGGLTAAALIAAARLGARCAFAGVVADDDPLWQFAIGQMRAAGIDVSSAPRADQGQPGYSVILVDSSRGTRNIFSDTRQLVSLEEHPLPPERIVSARALLVDHVDAPGMIGPAQLARANGIPVVADLESARSPAFADLLELVDHLIVSRTFAEELTCSADPATAARRLLTRGREMVAITCGAEGCWFIDHAMSGEAAHVPAFNVKAIDTTGCGDVFHGAYAAALARGTSDLRQRLLRASAAAAVHAAGAPLQESAVLQLLDG